MTVSHDDTFDAGKADAQHPLEHVNGSPGGRSTLALISDARQAPAEALIAAAGTYLTTVLRHLEERIG